MTGLMAGLMAGLMTGMHDDMVVNPVMYCPAVARATIEALVSLI